MPRIRLSTTVDQDLLMQVRALRIGSDDATLIDEALRTLLARQRAAAIDAEDEAAYAKHPVDEADAWGDLASFREAAGAP